MVNKDIKELRKIARKILADTNYEDYIGQLLSNAKTHMRVIRELRAENTKLRKQLKIAKEIIRTELNQEVSDE